MLQAIFKMFNFQQLRSLLHCIEVVSLLLCFTIFEKRVDVHEIFEQRVCVCVCMNSEEEK